MHSFNRHTNTHRESGIVFNTRDCEDLCALYSLASVEDEIYITEIFAG